VHYVILRDFLSTQDCDTLIAMGKQKQLERSSGFSVSEGRSKVSDYRTSYQNWFNLCENAFITKIEKRISEITGTPIEYGEGLQFCYYPEGTYYKAHHDYYDTRYAGVKSEIERGGQRVITFMVYLNTIPEGGGGETSFFNERVMIRPEKGKAVIFWNLNTNYELDVSTYHEALPPKPGYEKYIINKWIHVREFI
jgi:prolyl 4-hydroxylase